MTPKSRRKAYLAAIVTHHLADYLSSAGAPNPVRAIRSEAALALWVVRAVANGVKHVENTRGKNEAVRFRSGSDHSLPSATAGAMRCGASALGDTEGGVIIGGEQGVSMSVLDAVRTLVRAYVEAFRVEHFDGLSMARLDALEPLPAEEVGL